jgi:hypothetical protein
MRTLQRIFIILLCAVAWTGTAQAREGEDGCFGIKRLRLSGGYTFFGGEAGNSLGAGTNLGGFAEFQAARGNYVFMLLGKVRTSFYTGRASFNEGGTPTAYGYRMLSGEALFGFRLHLIPAPKVTLHFRPYISVLGDAGFAHLTLPIAAGSATNLRAQDLGILYGYEVAAGVEIAPGRHGFEGWAFLLEVQYRGVFSTFGGLPGFRLDGISAVGGVSW